MKKRYSKNPLEIPEGTQRPNKANSLPDFRTKSSIKHKKHSDRLKSCCVAQYFRF